MIRPARDQKKKTKQLAEVEALDNGLSMTWLMFVGALPIPMEDILPRTVTSEDKEIRAQSHWIS